MAAFDSKGKSPELQSWKKIQLFGQFSQQIKKSILERELKLEVKYLYRKRSLASLLGPMILKMIS